MATDFIARVEANFGAGDSSDQVEIIKNLAASIADKREDGLKVSLLDVVEGLGPFLTDATLEKRKYGTEILSELVYRVQPMLLNIQETDVLTLFFCDRLKDHHSIQPVVVYGLLGIVSYQRISANTVSMMCQTFFQEVHVQSLTHADRKNAYNMLSNLLNNYIDSLLPCGQEFVLGLIQSIDGEKDPRNLLVCFELVRTVVDLLPFENFREDLFEVVACYFPIDFHPPPDDKFSITQEQLVLGLRQCISRTARFAEYAVPLLLDKLASDMNDVKMDALHTLVACLTSYQADDLKAFTADIWSSIRRDLLLNGLSDLQTPCQDVINAMVGCFQSSSWSDSGVEFLDLLLRDCLPLLGDADRQNYVPAVRLLAAAVKNSCFAFTHIANAVFPLLCSHSVGADGSLTTKSAGLCALNEFLGLALALREDGLDTDCLKSLDEMSDHVNSYLTDSNYRDIVPSCIKYLTYSGQLRSKDEAESLASLANQVLHVLCESKEQEIWSECVRCLCRLFPLLSDKHKTAVLATTERVVKEALLMQGDYADNLAYSHLTCFCCELCSKEQMGILQMFHSCFLEVAALDVNNSCLEHALSCFNVILEKYLTTSSFDEMQLCHNISALITAIQESNTTCVETSCHGLQLLLMKCDKEQQVRVMVFLSKMFGEFMLAKENEEMWGKLSCVIKSVVAPVYADSIPSNGVDVAMSVSMAAHTTMCDVTASNAGKIVASLMNKINKGNDLDRLVAAASQMLDEMLSAPAPSDGTRVQHQCTFVLWCAKALLLRWHEDVAGVMAKIVRLLSVDVYAVALSESFGILLQEYDDVLNEKCHANFKLFYKQRFLLEIMPTLIRAYNGAENRKPVYLKAITKLLQSLPTSILKGEVKNLLPLLMQALCCDDKAVILCTLETIMCVDDGNCSLFAEHVTSLVDRYTTLALHNASMKVRCASLKCLHKLVHLETHLVIPLRRKVAKDLKSVLDDRKRLVRREAVLCRNAWCLL